MSYKREVIDVRVSRRILWVGAEAYPLHNIARAQTIKLVVNRGAAIRSFVKSLLLWAILGAAGVLAINAAGSNSTNTSNITNARNAVVAVALLMVGVSLFKLVRTLSTRKLYALVIETAGTPRTALVGTDENVVGRLVYQIMDAIDNPQAEFQLRVENFHVGDKIQQFGNHNLGKVTS